MQKNQTLAALPLVERSGVPIMTMVAPVSQFFEPPRKNVFRFGTYYHEAVYRMAVMPADQNPGRKGGVTTQDDHFGTAVAEGFARALTGRKLNVVFDAKYKRGQQDFSAEIVKLKNTGAEVFILGGILAENVATVKEMERLSYRPQTGMYWVSRLSAALRLVGPAGDGVYCIDYAEPDGTVNFRAFTAPAARLLTDSELKGVNGSSVVGYASTRLLIDAMRRCKELTWACAIAEIEKTRNFDTGVVQPISFGAGMRFAPLQLRLIRAGAATATFKPLN